MIETIRSLLSSTRFKTALFAVVLALFHRYLPDMAPDDLTLNWLYAVLIALIGADTVRPVDPRKNGHAVNGRAVATKVN